MSVDLCQMMERHGLASGFDAVVLEMERRGFRLIFEGGQMFEAAFVPGKQWDHPDEMWASCTPLTAVWMAALAACGESAEAIEHAGRGRGLAPPAQLVASAWLEAFRAVLGMSRC